MGWYYGKVVAKDLLNFAELQETWSNRRTRYGSEENVNFKVKQTAEEPEWGGFDVSIPEGVWRDAVAAPASPMPLGEFSLGSMAQSATSDDALARARDRLTRLRGE
jgi:hypothetical protein